MNKKLILLGIVFLLIPIVCALDDIIIDDAGTNNIYLGNAFGERYDYAQSMYEPVSSGVYEVTEFKLWIQSVAGSPSDLVINVYNDTNGLPNDTIILATGTLARVDSVNASLNIVTLNGSVDISIKKWFVVTTVAQDAEGHYWHLYNNLASTYDNGTNAYMQDLSGTWINIPTRDIRCQAVIEVPPVDTTPAGLLDDDAWCTSCSPVQKIDNQPWKTDDTTPTVNATMNESATCAIIGAETTSPNYNYTDTIAKGGVECTTTGTVDQICTIQSSNALNISEDNYICVGCKDGEPNELLNATFCAGMNITDVTSPIVSVEVPNEDDIFGIGINNTITFRWNATDNHFEVFSTYLKINDVLKYLNTSYKNGTDVVYIETIEIGIWQGNFTAIDNHSNSHSYYLNFTVTDIIAPNITILSPENNSVHTVDYVDLNWTSNEAIDWCAYSLDGKASNTSICYGTVFCYQEFANESTACGGLATGNYSCEGDWGAVGHVCDYIYDGNWTTFGSTYTFDYGYFYVNYTKPIGAVSSSLWKVKQGGSFSFTTVNLPISSNCWNHDGTKLIFKTEVYNIGDYTKWYCKDGDATWELLSSLEKYSYPYEEAMLWNLSEWGISGLNAKNITLTLLSEGSHNVTIYANDSLGNIGQSDYHYFDVDGTNPIVNTSINNTSPKINEVVNISANITDGVGLSFCQVIENQTGSIVYTNYSLSGTDDKCSKAITISVSRGNVINLTIRANDTSNHFTTNDTIITVADTVATVSIGINDTTPKINEVVNVSSNTTDADGLDWCLIKTNQTGAFTNNTFALSGTSGFCSDPITINVGRGNVINFTIEINDSVGNIIYENSTKVTVADTVGSISVGKNITTMRVDDVINISGNITEPDGDIDWGMVLNNQTGASVNTTFDLSGYNANFSKAITITATRGTFINFTVWYNDTAGNIHQNSTNITVSNTAPTCTAGTLNNTSPYTDDTIKQNGCSYSDADSDSQSTSQYKWFLINSEIIGETSQTLNLATTGNGNKTDTINASERAYDGYDYAPWINVSVFATVQNSPPPIPTILYPTSDLRTKEQPLDLNVTFSTDADGDSITINYYIDGKINTSSVTTNTTFNASDRTYILNVSLHDGTDSSTSNATVNFTIDTTAPTLAIYDKTGAGTNKTTDTTPTINLTTNENADCNISTDNSTWTLFTVTGEGGHTGTVDSSQAFSIGENKKVYVRCDDDLSNIAYGNIIYNITDGIPPVVNLIVPEDNSYFKGANASNVQFSFNFTDNYFRNTTCNVSLDGTNIYYNTTVLNGTNTSFRYDLLLGADQIWNVSCEDEHNNQNSSIRYFTVEQLANVTLFLNELSQDRKYEFRTIANLTANCTSTTGVICDVCINITAPYTGENVSCGINWTSYLYNITTLRQDQFSNGSFASSNGLNVSMNNKTEMIRTYLNVTSSGTTTNLNISYYGNYKNYTGDLIGKYLKQTEFVHLGVYKDAVNLTYTTGGSNYIYIDIPANVNNLTFELTGFDLDTDNEFSYIEHFNGTPESKGINETLSYHVDSPLGYLDDFTANNSRWNLEDITGDAIPDLDYAGTGGEYLSISLSDGDEDSNIYLVYSDSDSTNDMRNTSLITVIYGYYVARFYCTNAGRSRGGKVEVYATDSISNVLLKENFEYGTSAGGSIIRGINNLTLIKNSEDYESWKVYINGTLITTVGLGDMDFTKQIELKFGVGASGASGCDVGSGEGSAIINLHQIEYSGIFLNRSTNNGTYKSYGNFTSKVLNVTKTNISRILVSWAAYEPSGTKITGYASNNCLNPNPTFESVQSGLMHIFTTQTADSNKLCVRFNLNSSVNITSPVVRKYEVDIIPGSIKNISIDLEDDGIDDWEYIGTLNSTNSPKHVNFTDIPTGDDITIKISAITAGQIQVDKFNLNNSLNPIRLNHTYFEDCSNCTVDFEFSGDSIIVSGLEFDFYGSWNYTATAWYSNNLDTQKIQVYYSPFNVTYPFGIESFNIFVSTTPNQDGMLNQSLISPFGQEIGDNESYYSTPIFNLTCSAYDHDVLIGEYLNRSLDSCITIELGPYANATDTMVLSNDTVLNISKYLNCDNYDKLYHFVNLTNCNVSQDIYFDPVFCFNAWCEDCLIIQTVGGYSEKCLY